MGVLAAATSFLFPYSWWSSPPFCWWAGSDSCGRVASTYTTRREREREGWRVGVVVIEEASTTAATATTAKTGTQQK
jgi:hypothetical protein